MNIREILDLIWVLAILFLVVSFVSAIVAAFAIRKESQKDDNAKEIRAHGKVLELRDDVFNPGAVGYKVSMPMDRLVFEDDQGNRIRLRNIKAKNILLAEGDTGIIVYRGETVYEFNRDR